MVVGKSNEAAHTFKSLMNVCELSESRPNGW